MNYLMEDTVALELSGLGVATQMPDVLGYLPRLNNVSNDLAKVDAELVRTGNQTYIDTYLDAKNCVLSAKSLVDYVSNGLVGCLRRYGKNNAFIGFSSASGSTGCLKVTSAQINQLLERYIGNAETNLSFLKEKLSTPSSSSLVSQFSIRSGATQAFDEGEDTPAAASVWTVKPGIYGPPAPELYGPPAPVTAPAVASDINVRWDLMSLEDLKTPAMVAAYEQYAGPLSAADRAKTPAYRNAIAEVQNNPNSVNQPAPGKVAVPATSNWINSIFGLAQQGMSIYNQERLYNSLKKPTPGGKLYVAPIVASTARSKYGWVAPVAIGGVGVLLVAFIGYLMLSGSGSSSSEAPAKSADILPKAK